MIGSRMDGLIPFLEKLPRGSLLIETGRARGESAGHRTGDGWSTLLLARHAERLDGLLVSIDLDAATEHICRKMLGAAVAQYVRFLNGSSLKLLMDDARMDEVTGGRKARLVLLDSGRDPQLTLDEFSCVRERIAAHGYLAIDDSAVKGKLLVPHLQGRDEWVQQRLEDPVVFQWRPPR